MHLAHAKVTEWFVIVSTESVRLLCTSASSGLLKGGISYNYCDYRKEGPTL